MSSTIVVFEKGSEALVAPLFGFQGIMQRSHPTLTSDFEDVFHLYRPQGTKNS